jgi:hypothetical protein
MTWTRAAWHLLSELARELWACMVEHRRLTAWWIVFTSLLGCARPRYLDAEVPRACVAGDVEDCLGWMAERDLAAAELELYDDAGLRRYVQEIAGRLARGSLLGRVPHVVIADRDDTYATSGGRIVIARPTLEKLGSEAELAAVIAHELAHLEGRHTLVSLFGPPPDEDHVRRRDAEAIADERAVWLLERAGYAPTAMASALRAVLERESDDHPLRADRIARVSVLATGRAGFVGRARLLARLEGMVVGRDPRLGERVGDAWIVPVLGLALALEPSDAIRADAGVLALARERATLVAYAVGAPWARELVARLAGSEVAAADVGEVVMGTMRPPRPPIDRLARLARAVESSLPQPAPGTRVVIALASRGGLVIEIAGRSVPRVGLRRATERELAAAAPARIVIARATRAGTASDVTGCPVLLDDPVRPVAPGDPVKCADRDPAPRR